LIQLQTFQHRINDITSHQMALCCVIFILLYAGKSAAFWLPLLDSPNSQFFAQLAEVVV